MRRREFLQSIGAGVATAGLFGAAESVAASGSYTDEYLDGYHYTKYVPDGATGGEPLVVMLHGCTQSPREFTRATRMNEVADEEGFAVIYPDQSSFANGYECWNWFYDSHTARSYGEGYVVTDMALHEVAEENLDRDRIYVAGFSAGASMVPNLLVSYPDVYAAGGVHAGVEWDAADSASEATYVMNYGGPDPWYQGRYAYDEMVYNGVVGRVPTVVFHGSADDTVAPVNGDQATIQAIETNDLASDGANDDNVDTPADDTTTGTTGGYDWQRDRYTDEQGRVNVEYWQIEGMGHDWAGGDPYEDYTAPDAPDASRATWDFFDRWSL